MNVEFLLLLAIAPIVCKADVIRTVFCRKQCTDYLEIPENSMPLCAPGHLQLKECGTVISCDWAEADRDKVRPMANSSDILCCYRAIVKEKGDCVEQMVPELEPIQVTKSFFDHCGFYLLSWFFCFVLFMIVVLQAGYIVRLRISGPKHQKVSQSDETDCPQAIVTYPFISVRHLDTNVNSGHLNVDELSSVHITSGTTRFE